MFARLHEVISSFRLFREPYSGLQIIKQIQYFSQRHRFLSEISYDEESFNKAAPIYQKALNNSGYTHHLTFSPQTPIQPASPGRKNRKREIIWCNPPYIKNVATNVGGTFLKIIDEEFRSPRSMCYIRSSTVTQLRSATAACPT